MASNVVIQNSSSGMWCDRLPAHVVATLRTGYDYVH